MSLKCYFKLKEMMADYVSHHSPVTATNDSLCRPSSFYRTAVSQNGQLIPNLFMFVDIICGYEMQGRGSRLNSM